MYIMRLSNEDIINEFKIRLVNEKSLKRKMQMKKILEVMNEL
jgi:hypothetical protein